MNHLMMSSDPRVREHGWTWVNKASSRALMMVGMVIPVWCDTEDGMAAYISENQGIVDVPYGMVSQK